MEIDLRAWPTFFDNQGHLLDEYKLRKSTFFYGLSNDIRSQAWPFLLNLWDRDSTSLNRHHIKSKLTKQYEDFRNGWINAQPDLFDPEMKRSIKTIGKDIRRTERTHPFYKDEDGNGLRMLRRILITLCVYDSEVSYVQGMNEIIAPILLTLQDEAETFWCFVKLMPTLRDRLLTLDISPQLSSTADLIQYFDEELYKHIEFLTGGHWLFCFRWFLLLFKNEFKMADILKLWDVMFSDHNTSHFEIFVATAIIIQHKEQILACSTSDQLLFFAQSVTSKVDVPSLIDRARDLSVKIASTDGLSDNLAALVKQVNKAPPPLVGFVRRRQRFTNVYSGRNNMNDDLIKSLLSRTSTQTAQTRPLFFNCTESPIPVPTENYLSGIQGAQPLTLAEAPELAPPPTAGTMQNPTGLGVSPLIGRSRRPDALYKDSIGANAANANSSYDHANSGYNGVNTSYDNNQGYSYEANYAGYDANYAGHDPNYAGYDANYAGHNANYASYDANYASYDANYAGYDANNASYDANYAGYDANYASYDANNASYNANMANAGYYRDTSNVGYSSEYDHQSASDHYQQQYQQDYYVQQHQQVNNQPIHIEPQSKIKEQEIAPAQESEASPTEAISNINDDFWDMTISVQTDEALS